MAGLDDSNSDLPIWLNKEIPVKYLDRLMWGYAGSLEESQHLPHLFTRPRHQLIILNIVMTLQATDTALLYLFPIRWLFSDTEGMPQLQWSVPIGQIWSLKKLEEHRYISEPMILM